MAKELDAPAAMPREIINKLALMEFCLKHGSMKFKAALDDSLRAGILRGLAESGESTPGIRGAAMRVAELLDNPEKLRAARDEGQRTRGHNYERSSGNLPPHYGSGSSDDARTAGYDRPLDSGLRKKLGLEKEATSKSSPLLESVDLLEWGEAKNHPPKQLRTLPPPPKKGQNSHSADSLLGEYNSITEEKAAPQAQAATKPSYDLLDL